MLSWSLAFLIIALLAALLGFAGIGGTAGWFAKILFGLFLAVFLEAMGHETAAAGSRAAALKQLEDGHFDIAFLDLKLDGENGLDLLLELLKAEPGLEVVVFTAYASIETAVEAMRRGATDYIPKPFTPEQIRQVLGRIHKTRKLEGRVAELE